MKFDQWMRKAFTIAVLSLAVLTFANPVFAQDDEGEGKPALESGIITLRYGTKSQGDRIREVQLENEPALSFDVFYTISLGKDSPLGKLQVSRQRVAFVASPDQKQKFNFVINRSDLTFVEAADADYVGPVVRIKAKSIRNGSKQDFFTGIIPRDFLILALKDFEAAKKQFELLTAGLRSTNSPTNLEASKSSDPNSPSSSSNDEGLKQKLYERFVNNRKTNPDVAYQAAKAYLQLYPDDKDETAELFRKWTAAYEKVKNENKPQ